MSGCNHPLKTYQSPEGLVCEDCWHEWIGDHVEEHPIGAAHSPHSECVAEIERLRASLQEKELQHDATLIELERGTQQVIDVMGAKYEARITELEAALRQYANRDNWWVCEEDADQTKARDWKPVENGFDIAEKALAEKERLLQQREGKC